MDKIMKSRCPYCNKDLEKTPTRKKECPNCREYMYVRQGEVLTKKESSFKDAKSQLLGMGLKGVGSAKSMDDLWRLLNKAIIEESKNSDFRKVSSIYLQMGVISFDEDRFKDSIMNYLLCSHFSSIETINSSNEYGMKLTFSDLMNRDNYMITSPVIGSIDQLEISGVDTHNLGVLAVTPTLKLDEKIELLKEVFGGKTDRLLILNDKNFLISEEKERLETITINVTDQNPRGCFSIFTGIVILGVLIVFL